MDGGEEDVAFRLKDLIPGMITVHEMKKTFFRGTIFQMRINFSISFDMT